MVTIAKQLKDVINASVPWDGSVGDPVYVPHWAVHRDRDADWFEFRFDRWHDRSGYDRPVHSDCDGPSGTTPALIPTVVTPLDPTVPAFSTTGAVVRGTAGDDRIDVFGGAEVVRGRGGNDTIVWDPDRGGGRGMVLLDGGGGIDTYVIGGTTDAARSVSEVGCVINVFQGPGVSSRDRNQLDLDAATVTARFEGDFVHFEDGNSHLILGFRDQDYRLLTPAQIAASTYFGPDHIRLDALSLFGLGLSGGPSGTTPALVPSVVTPLDPNVAAFSVTGATVRGSAGAERIDIAGLADLILGLGGNDVIHFDTDRISHDRNVLIDAGGGRNNTILVYADDGQPSTAAMPGCLITGFLGPGVSSRSVAVVLPEFGAGTTARLDDDGVVQFTDGDRQVRIGYRDPNYAELTPEQIAEVTFLRSGLQLTSADFVVI